MSATTEALDATYIIAELEDAGRTLMTMPHKGYTTTCRTSGLDFVREAIEAYGWETAVTRPAIPPSAKIDRMDTVLAWISLIPSGRFVLRRVVGCRALINPVTDRHVFSWRRLGNTIGCSHEAVRLWHGQGIDLIISALARRAAFYD